MKFSFYTAALLMLIPIAAECASPRHIKVYGNEGEFAAWPANHGIWSWGNEILVGFQVARYSAEGQRGHAWISSTSRHKFARSHDGGETWSVEDAFEQGITAEATGHRLGSLATSPKDCGGGIDFTHPDFAFTFRRRTDASGPTSFYYSYDRGKAWQGPFTFPNLDTAGIASRTDYILEGRSQLLVFLTTAKSDGEIGRTACARTTDGGKTWQRVSWIGPEPKGQAIMPASVRLSPTHFVTVLRRREDGRSPDYTTWLEAYHTKDSGLSWTPLGRPAEGLGWNGNPPTLLRLEDGRLGLVYGVRGAASAGPASRICVRFSSDAGVAWGNEISLRDSDGASRDMGYTRAVQRPDGKVVVVYYYNHALDKNREPYRFIAATIFDPALISPTAR